MSEPDAQIRPEHEKGGTDPAPVREFNLRSAFALSFADLSPIVGIYTVFAIGLVAAGPAFLWAFPIVLIGQLFVAAVFGHLVSKWPFQGSVYAWSRELIGPRFGWFSGWAYMWGLTLTLAVLPLASAPYLLGAFGVDDPSQLTVNIVALILLLSASVVNLFGGKVLKTLIYIALVCELVASAGIGIALLLFHRVNSISVIFDTGGTGSGFHWLWGSFLIPVGYVAYSFIGFEASASIGEEVKDSHSALPKAVVLSLCVGGFLVILACLGLILAIPDIPAVMSGADSDPISTTLESSFGSGAGRGLLVALVIGFMSSLIAVQTAVTRAIWANARDKVLPGSNALGRLSGRENLPRNAILLTVVVAGVLLFFGTSDFFALLVSFSAFGFILSYWFPVMGLAYLRRRGGDPRLEGAWGSQSIGFVGTVAAIWLTFAIINLAWPRTVTDKWYLNWGIIIMTCILAAIGSLIVSRVFRPGSPGALASAERSATNRVGGDGV